MNTIIDRTHIGAAEPFDLAAIKAHVRIDVYAPDAELRRMAWTAASEFEQAAQVTLLTQTINLTKTRPYPSSYIRPLVGPIDAKTAPVVTVNGAAFEGFEVLGDLHPVLWSPAYQRLDVDLVTVEYRAGFGPVATDIPTDIAQAIADQVALLFDELLPIHWTGSGVD